MQSCIIKHKPKIYFELDLHVEVVKHDFNLHWYNSKTNNIVIYSNTPNLFQILIWLVAHGVCWN